jgi:uncharacterized protein (TIGR02646 family)
MRHLKRLPEPEILSQKKQEWTRSFVSSGKNRPDNSKYAHKSIQESLNAMSFHKCFYCERTLKGAPKEIDHYMEVAEVPEAAFEWENLYLACYECNGKFSNKVIPNTETLNPCVDSDEEIMRHLTFEDEIIKPYNNSAKGAETIRKYKLGSESLDYLRMKYSQSFNKQLEKIKESCHKENNRDMNEEELESLRRFQQLDHPFSLMFKIILRKRGIV